MGVFWLKGKGGKIGHLQSLVYPLQITEVVFSLLARLSISRGYRSSDAAGYILAYFMSNSKPALQ